MTILSRSLVLFFCLSGFFSGAARAQRDVGYTARYQDCMMNLAARNGWSSTECDSLARGEAPDGISAEGRKFAENSAREIRAARRPKAKKAQPPAAIPASANTPSAAASQSSAGAGLLVLLLLAIFAYFVPAIVAESRHHHQKGAIFALNLLLGWTLLGWAGAMVWACTATPTQSQKT